MAETILRECRDKVERANSLLSRGICTEEECLKKRMKIYHETCGKLRESLSEDNLGGLREQLLTICGLQLITQQYHPVDLGFDVLEHGLVYAFKNIGGAEQIWNEGCPEGRTFVLQLPLQNGGEWVRKEYTLRIIGRMPEENGWSGWNVYKGAGEFLGYNGGAKLFLRKTEGQLESVVYQKCYQNPNDPVWSHKKAETETCFILADMKTEK